MANYKITQLTELAETPAATDQFVFVDVSDTTQAPTGTTKRLAAQRMVFQNNGTVGLSDDLGVGTVTPLFRLHVLDSAIDNVRIAHTSTSGQPMLSFAQVNTRRSFIQHNDTNDTLKLASEYGEISFEAASTLGSNSETEYMRIKAGGNVGIGTNTPNSKLEVAGTVQCDGFRLDQTPVAGTFTTTHHITINVNGTNYRIPIAV